MDSPVTFEVLAWAMGAVFIFICGNWIFTFRSDQGLHRRISNHGQRLDSYRLEAVDKYASVAHLKEVEKRLIGEIQGMREDFKELATALLKNNNRG